MNAAHRNPPPAPTSPAVAPAPVLALLDDAATAAALVEWSATLARALRRELSLVYVESARSLVAAALPLTQVLAPGRAQWRPFAPADIEQGFRVQAARLRELAARIAGRDALHWSLRTMRGELADTARHLQAEADLLLLPPPLGFGSAAWFPLESEAHHRPGPPAVRHRPVLLVLADAAPESPRALQVAYQLAEALRGTVEVAALDADRIVAARADLVVLSRLPDEPALLARLRCPLLRVG